MRAVSLRRLAVLVRFSRSGSSGAVRAAASGDGTRLFRGLVPQSAICLLPPKVINLRFFFLCAFCSVRRCSEGSRMLPLPCGIKTMMNRCLQIKDLRSGGLRVKNSQVAGCGRCRATARLRCGRIARLRCPFRRCRRLPNRKRGTPCGRPDRNGCR